MKLSKAQRYELAAWAWACQTDRPLYGHHERDLRGVSKPTGEALVRLGLAEGPYHDHPGGWKVRLNDEGAATAQQVLAEHPDFRT